MYSQHSEKWWINRILLLWIICFQVNYENVDKPEIMQWVSHFVKELQLTGQISFDFIQAEDGIMMPSATPHSLCNYNVLQPSSLADAYLSATKNFGCHSANVSW